ncbi:membrane protein insertion efficiency factor YidD [Desulfosporosinus fructosivorans]|uniref:Putative membrane protein insertion efficiency factor n=1 Tax=Desulfosporosinus fructosivorans TaxID=2018669 RepID=A0A4Z0R2H1_9FIRM|nr:membrane protein insertion efficiency factor YidD [Desulfosporosinus fructosivorans]TGE36699.1 membrane protein insertion efficiency factor YidD [Desulfosporosinus fructosivorans]
MMKKILVFLIRLYQKFLSPLKGQTCRFYPSCSEYSVQVIQKYGLSKGSWKAIKRISKCHPFHPGGHDPA